MGSKSPAGHSHLFHRIINIPEKIEPVLPPGCCIYEVPINLRQVKKEAYTPLLISIGPLHHGKEELSKMEKQKHMYFDFFWERLPNEQKLEAYETYEAYLRDNELKIRSCYSEKYEDDHDSKKTDFVSMILLDSVFIVELFLRNLNKSKKEEVQNDYIFTKPLIRKTIQRDLLLLENQLPIFVLEELYDTVVPKGNFLHLAYQYFEPFNPMKSSKEAVPDDANKKPIHFTDLIRYFYLPSKFPVQPPSDVPRNSIKLNEAGKTSEILKGRQGREEPCHSCFQFFPRACSDRHRHRHTPDVMRNAMKLEEAGITFEKRTGKRLLDINFKKGRFGLFLCFSCSPCFTCFKARFQIPQLKVEHITECVLRNLIAFEQCHYPKTPYICNYVSLIDSLIHTTGDVELLIEKQVLVHDLGSHKHLATLVNGLCQHVETDATCYQTIISDLNQHYQSFWNRSMAALRLVYFRDPWRSSSTLVGILIVVFAIFQFIRVIRALF